MVKISKPVPAQPELKGDYEIEVYAETGLIKVSFNYIEGKAADRDEYGRPTECDTYDEVEIVTAKLIEGEMPSDEEIEIAILESAFLPEVLCA